jgi:hypothetical protein
VGLTGKLISGSYRRQDNVARARLRPSRSFLLFFVGLCVAAAAPSAAFADYPRADGWGRGAHISKASISKGRVTVSCTFHKTHLFFAQIYANPSNTDAKSPSRIRWVRTIPLGEHQAGHGHVSFLERLRIARRRLEGAVDERVYWRGDRTSDWAASRFALVTETGAFSKKIRDASTGEVVVRFEHPPIRPCPLSKHAAGRQPRLGDPA